MNLFEETAANEILSRLDKIEPGTQPQWGKMNAAQMMAHCEVPFHVYFGDMRLRRSIIGMLFGKMAKKKLFSGKPWPRNLPTAKQFRMAGQKEFDQEKAKLVQQIHRFVHEGYTVTKSSHPFFGKMSSQEWATLAYNHLNHHLEQFGV